MNTNDSKKTAELTAQDLALLGEGALGYIKEIEITEPKRMLRPIPNSSAFTTPMARRSRSQAPRKLRWAAPSSMS
jgi:hypothetical protein